MKELTLPDWILDMQQAGLIIEVERFSKFCTGAAMVNLHVSIRRVPSWVAAIKTVLEIELASKGKDWAEVEKIPQQEIVAEKSATRTQQIEPREYMSNERTLLKWVRMCFLALFVGMALLGFQHEPVTGVLLTAASLIVLFRAYFVEFSPLILLFIYLFLFICLFGIDTNNLYFLNNK
ncbi:hypothetical protein RFI_03564 [Reticulomyxa filosa]|uniref:DUF202 domain-containing protein n=1 Tax=Reticulomyxa filosa TaxID=46433 RepID=X6P5Q8_RETFI|nr:hypothetical protein RFI_03564 [Reticulomyxa filosa]|eukprot:ETO33541.1 hypothetical protein RFI_03564 [Reticulomyxa filosa]